MLHVKRLLSILIGSIINEPCFNHEFQRSPLNVFGPKRRTKKKAACDHDTRPLTSRAFHAQNHKREPRFGIIF